MIPNMMDITHKQIDIIDQSGVALLFLKGVVMTMHISLAIAVLIGSKLLILK